jgi:hypothetical protein
MKEEAMGDEGQEAHLIQLGRINARNKARNACPPVPVCSTSTFFFPLLSLDIPFQIDNVLHISPRGKNTNVLGNNRV